MVSYYVENLLEMDIKTTACCLILLHLYAPIVIFRRFYFLQILSSYRFFISISFKTVSVKYLLIKLESMNWFATIKYFNFHYFIIY